MPSVEENLELQRLEPLRREFAVLVATDLIDGVGAARTAAKGPATDEGHRHRQTLIAKAVERARSLAMEVIAHVGEGEATPLEPFVADVRAGIEAYLDLPQPRAAKWPAGAKPPAAPQPDKRARDAAILSWLAARGLGGGSGTSGRSERCRARVDEWRLAEHLSQTFSAVGVDGWRGVDGVRTIVSQPAWRQDAKPVDEAAADILRAWLGDEAARRFVGVKEHDGTTWFDRDGFNQLVDWTAAVAGVRFRETEGSEAVQRASRLADLERVAQLADTLRSRADQSGYLVDRIVTNKHEPASTGAPWPADNGG